MKLFSTNIFSGRKSAPIQIHTRKLVYGQKCCTDGQARAQRWGERVRPPHDRKNIYNIISTKH